MTQPTHSTALQRTGMAPPAALAHANGTPFSAAAAVGTAPPAQPRWSELVAERAALVRFARRRLADAHAAEDLVHDVFEAVASGRARFDGRASLRTWLTAILKHKIVDHLRSGRGHASLDEMQAASDEGGTPWEIECPQPRPDEAAERRQQLARVLQGIAALPATLREAFERRVLAEQESAEVCLALGISENNLFVRLHRARAMLIAA